MKGKAEDTVIIPAYNAEKYIEKAVDSALGQSVPVDVMVVDDCSTDATAELLKKYINNNEISYIKNEKNSGVATSRNNAMKLVNTTYIAFLDADDWWVPDKIEKQLNKIREVNCVMCSTGRELVSSAGESLGKYIGVNDEITYNMLLKTNSIACSSVLILTEVAKEFYMVHDELHEDYIMWLRVLKKYGICCGVDEPLLKSRMSEGGKSRNKVKSAKMQWGVYRFLGVGTFKSLYYMVTYVINGIRKYS